MHSGTPYKPALDDIRFVLWDQLSIQDSLLSDSSLKESFSKDVCDSILESACVFACDVLGRDYQKSDTSECFIDEDRKVILPQSFEYLRDESHEAGFCMLNVPENYGGLAAPYILGQAVNEMLLGAHPAFGSYFGFCGSALALIETFGGDYLKEIFSQNLASQKWSAALAMTEAQAGSDVGSINTRAYRQSDGTYLISGQKIFITAGMHDLSENIVYIVLARAEGAPMGTTGLSCFIVPRFRVDGGNTEPKDNDISCIAVEKKMGLHALATCQLSFGANGGCKGYLLGEKENSGLRQVLSMMTQARIATGIYALGLSSSAYRNAVEYAKIRTQGTHPSQAFNPHAPRVEIIQHLDVRRMLLEMKWRTEGCRALLLKLCFHQSMIDLMDAPQNSSRSMEIEHHKSIVSFLTPIVKSYTSDQAWKVCELAIQTMGGYGYTRDFPVEQYARDCKILSIWEGTNYLQAADLIRDKLRFGTNEKIKKAFFEEIDRFLEKEFLDFTKEATLLKKLRFSLSDLLDHLSETAKAKKFDTIFTFATRYLEIIAEFTVGWLLLDAAIIAKSKLESSNLCSDEKSFLKGKMETARFFYGAIMPLIEAKANIIRAGNCDLNNADFW